MTDAPAGISPISGSLGPSPGDLLWVAARPDDRPGRAVVDVVGEVDDYTAPLLASCLRGQSARPAVRTLVVDLSGVRLLARAGLAAIEDAAKRCAARGARLVLRTGEQRAVTRVLEAAAPSLPLEVSPGEVRSRRIPDGKSATDAHHRPHTRAGWARQTAMTSLRQASGSASSRR